MGRHLTLRARPSAPVRFGAGFTLLEVVVTLVVLGLAAALVAPVFARPAPDPDSERRRLVALARETAVRRAESLVLDIDGSGAWRLIPAATTTSIGGGRALTRQSALTLRVSPLGACLVEQPRDTVPFDLACQAPAPRR